MDIIVLDVAWLGMAQFTVSTTLSPPPPPEEKAVFLLRQCILILKVAKNF